MTEHIDTKEHKVVLLAEDEKDLSDALTTALTDDGHEVIVAADGEEALALAFERHPDLILLDIHMPKKTGKEVLEELRVDTWGATAKVLILTVLDDIKTVTSMDRLGGYDYLIKNDWKLVDLVTKVREKLHS